MKKIVLFAVFSCVLIILMPMISSVETNLVKEEINNRFNNEIFKSSILDFLKNKIGVLDIINSFWVNLYFH